ncbi:hypothetical protein AND_007292 [Anopheles darlingi]|uniref:Ig-like domain-containing protein n=1 Tax=Anopheles darlingi TaxID=43151 RepID=W5JAN8_ANODA|nr:hypothetical protein AND_007292 [Anopheles darlingi]
MLFQITSKVTGQWLGVDCRCRGRPQPSVKWLINGILVDEQYEHNSGDVIENRLLWPAIQRSDLNSIFTCQATNTLLVEPKESSFVLDLHRRELRIAKPTEIPEHCMAPKQLHREDEDEFGGGGDDMGIDPEFNNTCPARTLQLHSCNREEILNNTTRSELSFVPTTEDDGKLITCRAENPNVTGLFLETSWKIEVVSATPSRHAAEDATDEITRELPKIPAILDCRQKEPPPTNEPREHNHNAYVVTKFRFASSRGHHYRNRVTRDAFGGGAIIKNFSAQIPDASFFDSKFHPPIVSLRLGSTLSADDIKEGDDVYFECHVQANPPWRKLHWLHDGLMITHNATARVIRSNQSLVLQKVTRNTSGNYSCSAINAEGETVSNQLALRVKYAPVCATDRITIVGAFRSEALQIACEVQADPPPRLFNWRFNNSGETLKISKERHVKNGSVSILHYTPVSDQDYGTLSCWGQNEVGTQEHPCFFQVVLAGK